MTDGMGPNMASKQQEVEVLESWEDIDGTDMLEEKFKSIITPPSRESRSNGMSKVPFNIVFNGDEALRTQYPVPAEPTVKILKRPSKSAPVTDARVVQPKKTLQQREQEYAEARLRILGETQQQQQRTEEKNILGQSKPRPAEVDNVIRLPKGPDGTKGFNLKR